jgi:hypothetical protein
LVQEPVLAARRSNARTAVPGKSVSADRVSIFGGFSSATAAEPLQTTIAVSTARVTRWRYIVLSFPTGVVLVAQVRIDRPDCLAKKQRSLIAQDDNGSKEVISYGCTTSE